MNLNEEFNKILDRLERIKEMASALYNEPMSYGDYLARKYTLRDELEILQDHLIEWQEEWQYQLNYNDYLGKDKND